MLNVKSTHANFSVDDIAEAKEFYVNKLNFKVYRDSDYGTVLESPSGSLVNIYAKDDHKAWDSTVLGIEVDDLIEAINQLAQAGIDIEHLPGTDEKGVMRGDDMGDAAWVKDTAGNWICISTGM